MINRKFIGFVSIALLCLLTVFLIVDRWPKEVVLTLDGVEYQLGKENRDHLKPVTIRIDGKVTKNFFGKPRFKGTIDIEGEEIPVPKDQRELNIPFVRHGWGAMIYAYLDNGDAKLYSYGTVFFNEAFNQITILKYDRREGGEGKRGWRAEDGLMITAPSTTRKEALQIANTLMQDFLHGYRLE